MRQQTLSDIEYSNRKRKTKREEFLEAMEEIIPWKYWVDMIRPGLIMHGGTVVDATLTAAPKSTKNREGKRDPQMHQTKKGNEWHFGMKIHSGVDAGSGGSSFYTSEGVIGAGGIYRTNYECWITNGFGKIGSFYLEFWEKYGIEPVPVDFYEYTINDETIYAYSILGETTDVKEQIIQNYLRENETATGVHLLTKDEAWERINENRKALGITEEMRTEAHEIVWQELSDENLGSSFSIAEILKNEYKKKANTER